ncbi:MAG TPA: peptidoglycan-binding protein [Anaerovoracaceae bacterium]|nr:peptidoglycan-binding protein [Anaerovoracaceae bacterium]
MGVNKKADLTSDLATNFDLASATKQTVMSDERDFSRPRESFNMSTAPSDILQAVDKPGDLPSWTPKKKEEPVAAIEAPKTSNDIKQFQTFFGLQPTGMADDKLAAAAKAMEDKIAKSVNNPVAHGMLWDDASKTFKTNLADLQEALKKIQTYESSKKIATSIKTPRKQAFLDLLDNNTNVLKKI